MPSAIEVNRRRDFKYKTPLCKRIEEGHYLIPTQGKISQGGGGRTRTPHVVAGEKRQQRYTTSRVTPPVTSKFEALDGLNDVEAEENLNPLHHHPA
jgi:hypothetical protein